MNRFLSVPVPAGRSASRSLTATPCVAQPANGMIAQERVVTLPPTGQVVRVRRR